MNRIFGKVTKPFQNRLLVICNNRFTQHRKWYDHQIKFKISFSTKDGTSSNIVFDRNVKKLQRDGAAMAQKSWKQRASQTGEEVIEYDYFRDEIASRLVDRLDDINRPGGFPLALDIGSGPGYIHRAICKDDSFEGVGGIGGVRKLVQMDSSHEMLHRDDDDKHFPGSERCGTYKLVADEESKLPFPDGTFDLVLSSAALHWVNDLPNLLLEIKRVLKSDGCFMFAMVGGSTLTELRSSLILAEMERDGGVSPHVGPFVEHSDVGSLISGAVPSLIVYIVIQGFTLPTIDIDTIKLGYPNAMVLMEHLQRMGENNASTNKRTSVNRNTFLAAACIYDELYKLETDEQYDDDDDDDDNIGASVQIIYGIGWTPHDSQPKPKERGSAKHKLGDIVEHTKGK